MKPIHFKEAKVELQKPPNMSAEECAPLWVDRTADGQCVSCWTTSFWQRVLFLFHGRIWLGILSGETQPPVWLDCTKTVYINDEKKRTWKLRKRKN